MAYNTINPSITGQNSLTKLMIFFMYNTPDSLIKLYHNLAFPELTSFIT